MTTIIQSTVEDVQIESEHIYDSIRGYLPALGNRLMLTYLLPLTLGLIAGVVVLLLANQALPQSTASILSFGANLLILGFGWRILEKHTGATSLFVSYTAASSARRRLRKLLTQAQSGEDVPAEALTDQLNTFEAAAQAFMDNMRHQGIIPRKR